MHHSSGNVRALGFRECASVNALDDVLQIGCLSCKHFRVPKSTDLSGISNETPEALGTKLVRFCFYRFSLPIDSNMGLFIPAANQQQLAIKTAAPASRSQ
ncbi:hypothetical protein Tsp_11382 [Trichinella spiralis]|uniref:hypothetical protein n=1 Tax=Trichinella spiralis TaxID=6334 RepID=UPI0001EFE733|nr:hypothetical protein Tsp_11382 [Trichinella spiralis]